MTCNMPRGYDAWRLSGPDETPQIGVEDGQTCNRFPEPDEDMPRGYKPRRCTGEMISDDGVIICDTCGELA